MIKSDRPKWTAQLLSGLLLALAELAVATQANAEPVTLDRSVTAGAATWYVSQRGSTGAFTGTCYHGAPGLTIRDASLSSHSDAFDDAYQLFIDGMIFAVGDTVDRTGTTITAGPASYSGLDVSYEMYFSPTVQAARFIARFANPTASPISATVDVPVNFGSDGDTIIQATSSGDTAFTTADRWLVTSELNDSDPDPVNTTVLYGPGSPAVVPTSVTSTVFDCVRRNGAGATFPITVPAGQARSLMFFAGLGNIDSAGNTVAGATAAAARFNSSATLNPGLLIGLSTQDLSEIVNWADLQAKIYRVDSFLDEDDVSPGDGDCRSVSGTCTLRAAVREVNAASFGPGAVPRIELPAGTFHLSLGGATHQSNLHITKSMEIWGARGKQRTIIDAGSFDRAFDIDLTASNQRVSLLVLDIRNGNVRNNLNWLQGGGVLVRNQGGTGNKVELLGLFVWNCLAVDGGAIAISDDVPGAAGVVVDLGTSTIATNAARPGPFGPGYGGFGHGGGVYVTQASLNAFNTTVSNNFADGLGGGIAIQGNTPAELHNVTIVQNVGNYDDVVAGWGGGGIFASEPIFLENSIVTGNAAFHLLPGFGSHNCFMSHSGGFNLLGSDCEGGPTDIESDAAQVLALGDYGGEVPSRPPVPGSLAIDSGGTCWPYDVHSPIRPLPVGGRCDIGAYEVNPDEMSVNTVGTGGGSVSSPSLAAEVDIPPGALSSDTTISVVTDASTSQYGIGAISTNLVRLATFGPDGLTFPANARPTIYLYWPDVDPADGIVDGSLVQAANIRVWRNGQAITSQCAAQLCGFGSQTNCCDIGGHHWRLQIDHFSEYAAGDGCGNAVVDPGEDCDAGASTIGSCCSTECTFKDLGSDCGADAGAGACDRAGSCVDPQPCGPCEKSDPILGCRGLVETSCAAAESGKSKLSVTPSILPVRQKVSWTWKNVDLVAKSDLGVPASGTEYLVCVFDAKLDGTSKARMQARIPAAGTCGGKPCWTENANGFNYKSKGANDSGIDKLHLKAGLPGKASLSFVAKGPSLELDPTPYEGPVTVQLKRVDTGACWSATYSSPTKNDDRGFKGRSD